MKRKFIVDSRYLWSGLVKLAVSVICVGVFYSAWLAVFLFIARSGNSVLEVIGWLSAPLVTALGFTIGVMIFEYLAKTRRVGLFYIFIWPAVGCVIGAGAVYWLGPMLIVFGMFIVGTASIVLRELFFAIEGDKG